VRKPVAILPRNARTAERVQEILQLPDERWSSVSVVFDTDEVATASVTFLLSHEQAVALAECLTNIAEDPT
jgi:hypothetical protein